MLRVIVCFCWALIVLFGGHLATVDAQLPSGWKQHDLKRPTPPVVEPGESNLPLKAPSDAIVLFDGKDLSNWRSEEGRDAKWRIVDGAMESAPGSGYVYTKEKFGDCQLHVEWASPAKGKGKSQGRGNSGVFLMSMFEVQILNSYNNPTYADGSAGSIYGQFPPLVNVCRKPGEWQSFDIIFRRPRFDGETLVSPAALTVLHNGVLVQNHTQPFGPSEWLTHGDYKPGISEESLGLQDHGNPVRYRNIWIRPLADPARPKFAGAYPKEYALGNEMIEKIIGEYDNFKIEKSDDVLICVCHGDRRLELVPVSDTEFVFRRTAGRLVFTMTEDGKIDEAFLKVDAAGQSTSKKK